MTFIRSLMLVAGVAASVSFAIFAGHALSTHHTEPILIGIVALAAGALLLFVYARTGRDGDPARTSH